VGDNPIDVPLLQLFRGSCLPHSPLRTAAHASDFVAGLGGGPPGKGREGWEGKGKEGKGEEGVIGEAGHPRFTGGLTPLVVGACRLFF